MTYQIADQPVDSSLRDYVVRPSAPLLASMFAGTWLAWPWFAFNAIAMGSPSRRREVALAAGAFVATGVLAAIVLALDRAGWIPDGAPVRVVVLGLVTFKLAITYYLSVVQDRTFHVYEYYGGPVRSPRNVLIAGILMRGAVLGLIDHPLWVIIVAGAA